MEITPGPLLQTITSPDDLKGLSREQLHQLCDELRQYIIDSVSVHGGHFAAMEEPRLLAEDIFRFAESHASEPVTA